MYFIRSTEAHCPVIACLDTIDALQSFFSWRDLCEQSSDRLWIEVAPRMLTSLTDIAELDSVQSELGAQLQLIFEKSEALAQREAAVEEKEIANQARANLLAHEKQVLEAWKESQEARERALIAQEKDKEDE